MQVCTLEARRALKVAHLGIECTFQDIQVGCKRLWQNVAACKDGHRIAFVNVIVKQAACLAGVLDFTAVEGTVAMPPLVARNLFGSEAGVPHGQSVKVTYRRLQKGKLFIHGLVVDTLTVL